MSLVSSAEYDILPRKAGAACSMKASKLDRARGFPMVEINFYKLILKNKLFIMNLEI